MLGPCLAIWSSDLAEWRICLVYCCLRTTSVEAYNSGWIHWNIIKKLENYQDLAYYFGSFLMTKHPCHSESFLYNRGISCQQSFVHEKAPYLWLKCTHFEVKWNVIKLLRSLLSSLKKQVLYKNIILYHCTIKINVITFLLEVIDYFYEYHFILLCEK